MPIAVMTGATSGIGEAAAARIASVSPATRFIVGARGRGGSNPGFVQLDLDSLSSARAFTAAVERELADERIDMLILNAGMTLPSDEERSAEGFERAFAVNHLAHYLILRQLAPLLADGARVILTTSDTHDPLINKLAPPVTANALRLAEPGPKPENRESAFKRGVRAYASSKLANILTARAFAMQPEVRERGITVIAYNPGFVPGTKVGRESGFLLKLALGLVVPIVKLFKTLNRVSDAGDALAALAVGSISPPAGRIYGSLVRRKLTWPEPSELARSNDAADQMWRDSAQLVGLAPSND